MSPDFESRFTEEAVKAEIFSTAQSNKDMTLATFNKASLIITHDGRITIGPLRKKKGKYFTLEDMQAAVGGFVEIAQLSEQGKGQITRVLASIGVSKEEANEIVDDLELVVNEEGLIHQLPVNITASSVSLQGLLAGPVVLARRSGWE